MSSCISTIYFIAFFITCGLNDGLLVPIRAPLRGCCQIGKIATTLVRTVLRRKISRTVLCQCKSKYSPKVINNARLCCRSMPPFEIYWGSKMCSWKDIKFENTHYLYLNVSDNPRGIQYWDKYNIIPQPANWRQDCSWNLESVHTTAWFLSLGPCHHFPRGVWLFTSKWSLFEMYFLCHYVEPHSNPETTWS